MSLVPGTTNAPGRYIDPEKKRKREEEAVLGTVKKRKLPQRRPPHEAAVAKQSAKSEKPRKKSKKVLKQEYDGARKSELSQTRPRGKEDTVRNLVAQARRDPKISEAYRKSLLALERDYGDPPTADQVNKLEDSLSNTPAYLGRIWSTEPGMLDGKHSRKTNGYSSQKLLQPATDVNLGYACHDSMYGMTQGELKYMIANHEAWKDLKADEFLSYSEDMCFLIEHGLGRWAKRQGQVYLSFYKPGKATAVSGQPAAFYRALDLYETFDIPGWSGWSDNYYHDMDPRQFTQEYLSHGVIKYAEDGVRAVSFNMLVACGLFQLFPKLAIPEGKLRTGLHERQVAYNATVFPPKDRRFTCTYSVLYSHDNVKQRDTLTVDYLNRVSRLARLFVAPDCKPPLHIFLIFLSLRSWERRQSVFMEYMKEYYSSNDLAEICYRDDREGFRPGLTLVANNLVCVMEYLDLLRDCCAALDFPMIPDTQLITECPVSGRSYADADRQYNQDRHRLWVESGPCPRCRTNLCWCGLPRGNSSSHISTRTEEKGARSGQVVEVWEAEAFF